MKTAVFRKAIALILTLIMLMTCVSAWATDETTTQSAGSGENKTIDGSVTVVEDTSGWAMAVAVEAVTDDASMTVTGNAEAELTQSASAGDAANGAIVNAEGGNKAELEVKEKISAEAKADETAAYGVIESSMDEGSEAKAKADEISAETEGIRGNATAVDVQVSQGSAEVETGHVSAEAQGEQSNAYGVTTYTTDGGNTTIKADEIAAETKDVNSSAYGVNAQTSHEGSLEVTAGAIEAGTQGDNSDACGVNAGAVIGSEIRVEAESISAETKGEGSDANGTVAAAVQGSTSTVKAEDTISAETKGNDADATGAWVVAYVEGKASVEAGNVEAKAEGENSNATAVVTYTQVEGSEAKVKADGFSAEAAQGNAHGILIGTDDEGTKVSVSAGTDGISAEAKGAEGEAYALKANEIKGTVTVNSEGSITATSESTATGIEATTSGGSVTVTAGGDVNVIGTERANGIKAVPVTGDITVDVSGDVTAQSEDGPYGALSYGIFGGASEGSSLTVRVGGGVTATSGGEDGKGIGVSLNMYGGKAEVEVSEDVSTDDTGVALYIGHEDDNPESNSPSESKIKVNGNVQVDGEGDIGFGVIGVKAVSYIEDSFGEIEVSEDVTATGEVGAQAIYVDAETGSIKVKAGGDISAISDGYLANGVWAEAEKGGEVQVDVDGKVYAASDYETAGVAALAMEAGAKVKVTVADGIMAETPNDEKNAAGIRVANYVQDGASGEVDISVSGNVNTNDKGIEIIGASWENEYLEGTVEIKEEEFLRTEYTIVEDGEIWEHKVYYNAEEDYYYDESGNMWRPEKAESGLTRIEIKGDVEGDNTGLYMDARAITDVIVDGTLSGGEHAVIITDETMADNLTLTVWEIQPNEDGSVAEYGRIDENGELQTEEAEDFEKTIQYIIKVEQPSAGATIATEGTFEYEGYNVAYEGDTVVLRVYVQRGYEIVDAYNGTDTKVSLLKDADGNYYLVVPKGGGVLLSVKLRKIAAATTKKYNITMDPNGGTLRGSTEPIVESAKKGQYVKLPEEPTKEGETFLGWYGTEYPSTDAQWSAPEEGSTELLKAETKVKVTQDYYYTAVWRKAE